MRILFFLLLIIPGLSFAQASIEHFSFTGDSDTSYYYAYVNERVSTFELTGIVDKEVEFVFRFWRPSGFVEVTKNGTALAARVTFMVIEAGKKERRFVKTFELPRETATSLYSFLLTSEAYQLPSSNAIDNWVNGLDGVTYVYEIKNESSLSFKWYWSPRTQEGVPEAHTLLDFNTCIDEIIGFEHLRTSFDEAIPFRSYKYHGEAYSIIRLDWRRK